MDLIAEWISLTSILNDMWCLALENLLFYVEFRKNSFYFGKASNASNLPPSVSYRVGKIIQIKEEIS